MWPLPWKSSLGMNYWLSQLVILRHYRLLKLAESHRALAAVDRGYIVHENGKLTGNSELFTLILFFFIIGFPKACLN